MDSAWSRNGISLATGMKLIWCSWTRPARSLRRPELVVLLGRPRIAFLKIRLVRLYHHRGQRIRRAHHLNCASPLNNQSLHDLAVNFVMTRYVGSNASQLQFEYLPDLCQQPGHHEHFHLSVCAVGLAGYSAVKRIPELTRTARMKYVPAIRQVNVALGSPEIAWKDSTMASVILLGMFEVIVSPSQKSWETYTRHLNGAIELAKMGSLQQFETDVGISLFKHLSLNIIVNCTLQSNPIHEYFIAMRRQLPGVDNLASPPSRFFNLMLRWVKFSHDVQSGSYASPTLVMEGALDLGRDLTRFGQIMLPK